MPPINLQTFDNNHQFVAWFRHASPYIHTHRGKTFVLSFEGAAVSSHNFRHLMHDIALLHSLGIRLVLVHGTRQRIERNLQERDIKQQYAEGMRITDGESLEQVKAACGQITSDIRALLSMGLSHSPQSYANIRVVGSNFVTAKPLGVRDGVDFMHTGVVRRVDKAGIIEQLDNQCVVLVSPLGYSPTGEIFNLSVEDVATSVAIALQAHKWLCLTEVNEPMSEDGYLTLQEAQALVETRQDAESFRQLRNAIRACENGVERVHLIKRNIDGGLLLELFSRDGVGTMVSRDPFENLRQASIDDIGGILSLITPLEQEGILVKRPRDKLEAEIHRFIVQERDGAIVACAALYPYTEDRAAELACLVVSPHYKGQRRGDALLAFMEQEALQVGINRLFVLTTHTAQWFQERGFVPADLDTLPVDRRRLYNHQRQSKVFFKPLEFKDKASLNGNQTLAAF